MSTQMNDNIGKELLDRAEDRIANKKPDEDRTWKPNLSMSDFSEALRVLVGPRKQEFHLPKALLCKESEFLKLACNEAWESGRTNTITLDEEDPVLACIFFTWTLTGSLDNCAHFIPIDTSNSDTLDITRMKHGEQLMRCYIVGDLLQAERFCNAIMDRLLDSAQAMSLKPNAKTVFCGQLSHIAYVYAYTLQNSPLRRFFLTNFFSRIKEGYFWEKKDVTKAPATVEFLRELAIVAIESLNSRSARPARAEYYPWIKPQCTFHTHRGQPEGYDCNTTPGKSN